MSQISTIDYRRRNRADTGRWQCAGWALAFGPSNPFYAESTLPFHAPPFDKIKDSDYQPAIEAGIAQNLEEDSRHRRQPSRADL